MALHIVRRGYERGTGPEIWFQLQAHGLRPDAMIAGVGTGGTIMGTGRFLREKHGKIRIHPLKPAKLVDLAELDHVVVTVLPDDNKKCLSTALLGEERPSEGYLSTDIQLLGFRAFNRVCNICFDSKESTQTAPLDLLDC